MVTTSIQAETPVTKPFEEERKTGSLDKRLYFKYMSLGLGPLMLPILVALLVAPQIIATFTEQFLLTNIAIKKVCWLHICQPKSHIFEPSLF